MSAKTKVINILSHPPGPVIFRYTSPEGYKQNHGDLEYIRLNKFPYWVGFFKQDFHHQQAKDLLKFTSEYEIECWRPYGNTIDKIYQKDVDGILHKIFPSNNLKIPKFLVFQWSRSLYKELLKETKNGNVIIHIHDGHSYFICWLLNKLKGINTPIIYQQYGDCFSIYHYKHTKNIFRYRYLYLYYLQKKAIRKVNNYLSQSHIEISFLVNTLKFNKVSYYNIGEDFNFYTPPKDKNAVKKELGLPTDSQIIIYLGRFYKYRGIHKILKAFNNVKNKFEMPPIMLVIGGYKYEEYYQMAIDFGAIVIERIPIESVKLYLQASDLNIMYLYDELEINFSGFGMAQVQALACGVPILSSGIIHFPGSIEERNQIGLNIESDNDLENKMSLMLSNLNAYKNCREVAKKYFERDITIKSVINQYNSYKFQ